jgi:hypothetical protein
MNKIGALLFWAEFILMVSTGILLLPLHFLVAAHEKWAKRFDWAAD